MAKLPISVQLFTIRDLTAADFAGAVQQVAGIGYKYVELAGWGNLTAAGDVRKALDAAGVKPSGAHVGIDQFKDINKVIADAQIIGYENVIIPYIGDDYRTAAGYKKLAGELNEFAKPLAAKGLVMHYHNHSFEFEKYDGKAGFDILWDATDPNSVKAELDVYWIEHGRVDPVSYIKKLGKRVNLLHLKDMDKEDRNKFTQVGKGTLDFPSIVAAGVEAGAKFGVVEQDRCYEVMPIDSITTSFNNLKKMGLMA